MNAFVETLNLWGDRAWSFAGTMFWQSGLLILVLFALDFVLRRRIRASVRYALWLVVLLKLVLPPTFAAPVGLAWWLRPRDIPETAQVQPAIRPQTVTVTYGPFVSPVPSANVPSSEPAPPPARPSPAAWGLLGSIAISVALLGWLVVRWRQVGRDIRQASIAPEALQHLLDEAKRRAGLRRMVKLRLTSRPMSPAVCGFLRPVVLLPGSLVETLSPEQFRAVLLHELIHVRRRDIWINCVQSILQIIYWWHPLVWLANARIRAVREEAVDDAVMLALEKDSEIYAPTLLEVARLAFARPLASLGLVGILESKHALRRRIERLVSSDAPRKAGLSIVSALGIAAFTALAVPMGEAPPQEAAPARNSTTNQVAATETLSVETLVQDGRLLYQLGKLPEAEVKLKKALELAPTNAAALYYSKLIAEAKQKTTRTVNTRRVNAGPGRQEILAKLGSIRLDSLSFKSLPLSEVVKQLSEEIRRKDPSGINFLLDPRPPSPDPFAPTDLAAGKPAKAVAAEDFDIKDVLINIDPPLTNLRAADALDAITKVADRPIKYSIRDYAVVFSPKPAGEVVPLSTRVFRVDPNTLLQGLQSVGTLDTSFVLPPASPRNGHFFSTNAEIAAVQIALSNFFATVGVDLKSPKSVFFNDRQGTLLVHATAADLDTIEAAIQTLNIAPPQVHISIKAIEVKQDDEKALGFDWYLGNYLGNSAPGKSLESTNPESVFPGTAPSRPQNPPATSPSANAAGVRAMGILSEVQRKAVFKALEKTGRLLSANQIITLSGRQAQLQVEADAPAAGATNLVQPKLTVDVLPYVSSDYHTIELRVGVTYGEEVNVPARVEARQRSDSDSMPHQAKLSDAQTLVLTQVIKPKSEEETEERHVLFFITPIIIDAAGNPVNADGNQPLQRF